MSNDFLPDKVRRGRVSKWKFTQTPQWALLMAELSDPGFRVYSLLLAHVNDDDDGEVWPQQQTMADMLARHRNSISRVITKELVPLGLVDVEVERYGTNNTRRRNIYTVHELPPDGFNGWASITEWYAAHPRPKPEPINRRERKTAGQPGRTKNGASGRHTDGASGRTENGAGTRRRMNKTKGDSSPLPPSPGVDGVARGAGSAGRGRRKTSSRGGVGRGAGAPAAAVSLVEGVQAVEAGQSDGGAPDAGAGTVEVHDDVRGRAERIMDDALRRWHSAHAAPNAATRRRLVQRVAAELADGADAEAVLRELTRDLHPSQAASAVRVVMARTKTPGWGRVEDPRPAADRHVPAGPRPPWCGRCDERTRLLVAIYEDARGEVREQMARCRDCHPDADVALDGAQMAADGPEAAVGAVPEPPPLEELVADLDAHRRRTEGGGQGRGQRVGLPPVVADVRQVLAEIQQRSRTTM